MILFLRNSVFFVIVIISFIRKGSSQIKSIYTTVDTSLVLKLEGDSFEIVKNYFNHVFKRPAIDGPKYYKGKFMINRNKLKLIYDNYITIPVGVIESKSNKIRDSVTVIISNNQDIINSFTLGVVRISTMYGLCRRDTFNVEKKLNEQAIHIGLRMPDDYSSIKLAKNNFILSPSTDTIRISLNNNIPYSKNISNYESGNNKNIEYLIFESNFKKLTYYGGLDNTNYSNIKLKKERNMVFPSKIFSEIVNTNCSLSK